MSVRITWALELEEALADPLEHALAEAVGAALDHGDAPQLRVDVIVVEDEALTELHGRYLDDPTPTDVIAFDLREEGVPAPDDPGPDAELYISLDCAQRVSAERGVSLQRELALYGAHGALHLCGYDDHDAQERAAMRVAERSVLRGLGYEDDPLPHE